MTVAIYHYVKPGKEAWKLFLLSLKARLFENMTSQASVPQTPESAASVVESLGDAALLTEEEVTTSQCCTCHKPIDKDNSLVIVRAGVKSSNEIRRCRACHSMRSAIERLKRNHFYFCGWRQSLQLLPGEPEPQGRGSPQEIGGNCSGLEDQHHPV